jgi:four helix bundle protein
MVSNQKEYTLSKQILRSGTSIGANVEEAIGGISKKTSYQNSQFHTKKQERLTTGSDF